MKLYNTLTRRKEEFVPLEEGKVKMYVCGPTVYNLIHIGNARPMIIFDTVRRYFEYRGYQVEYVSNFTDVDDKIIKKALEEGVSAQEISERYIAECKKDMAGMNVKPATVHPQATQEIDGMISMIQTLMDKGYAYAADDGTVYFRVKKFKEYGKLSHKNLDDLQSGFRALQVSGEDQKEDPLDFVLWKPKKEGEPYWESPWCKGRPGWHIECSVMSKKYLGEEIDIHAGGEDLIFPHHENEIAQSECCNDKIFARYFCEETVAGGNICNGTAKMVFNRNNRHKIIILCFIQGLCIQCSTRCNDPYYCTLYQSFGKLWIFHLFADGHFMSTLDQTVYVGFCCMKGNPAHRCPFFQSAVLSGEGQFQFL